MQRSVRVIDRLLMVLAAVLMLATAASLIWNQPILLTAIRSESMYPLLERGDLVLIWTVSSDEPIETGDLVVFKTETGDLASKGYVVHRVVGGDAVQGFITQGGNNDYSDQAVGNPLIQRPWIASRVLIWQEKPLHLPLVGFLPIWLENIKVNRYALPIVALILVVIIGLGELKKPAHLKKKQKGRLDRQLIFFTGGLTLTILMAATMLVASEQVTYIYDVTQDHRGAILGSSAGILIVGDELDQPLADLENKGFLPVVVTIVSADPQLTFSQPSQLLGRGQSLKTHVHLLAEEPGSYRSKIQIGLFYHLLPIPLIDRLARINYWLALALVAVIPGMPLLLFPLFDRDMRRGLARVWRRKLP